jgi:hypothetical protein
MQFWPFKVSSWSRDQIDRAIEDKYWQAHRKSMKGKPTVVKLDMLNTWRINHTAFNSGGPNGENRNPADVGVVDEEARIQIDNYINALKRGGLLNEELWVVR